jgi:hypothetical protein
MAIVKPFAALRPIVGTRRSNLRTALRCDVVRGSASRGFRQSPQFSSRKQAGDRFAAFNRPVRARDLCQGQGELSALESLRGTWFRTKNPRFIFIAR